MNDVPFSHHEGCEHCGSRDNKGVWKDGHTFCFGCGRYTPAHTTMDNFRVRGTKEKDNSLPSDASYHIPPIPLRWIKQYGITDKEITDNQLMWSRSKEMLIFPYFGAQTNELLFWQGRFFPQRKPKTITYGYPDRCLSLLGSSADSVVVCEDPVSAIKVARVTTSCPLFGSYLSLATATRLSKMFDTLYIWLDQDKTKEGMKFKSKYDLLFKNITVVSTPDDPKSCPMQLIEEKLNGII